MTLRVRGLSFGYAISGKNTKLPVLESIDLNFFPGQITALVGPSGSGKTTLLNLLAGLMQPASGSIELDGVDESSIRQSGYVFQTPSLIPWRTIEQNALLGAEVAGRITAELRRRCLELLRTYGLEGFENAYPVAISGGMQQRVSVVRAALSGAKVILLDEPFSNSDFAMRQELQREISRLVSEEELIAVLVTHDINDAIRIGDRVVVLTARPARVKAEIEISIPRADRVNNGSGLMEELMPFFKEVWSVLDSVPELATGH